MILPETVIVPAAGSAAVMLRAGDHLRVVNGEGGQTGDLLAFSPDGSDRLSNGRSFDYCGKIYLSVDDVLWSERSRKMLAIVADDTGRHDFLYAPCSSEMYRMQYGAEDHPNCRDNLRRALSDLGVETDLLPTAFNLFMIADVEADGRIAIKPPVCPPGSAIRFRAEMDLAVAVSSCPAGTCNGGEPLRPLTLEVFRREGEG
jgi:uncharacterized protein YcgI (DUF1989 family)